MREVGQALEVRCEADGRAYLAASEVKAEEVRKEEVRRGLEAVEREWERSPDGELVIDSEDDALVHEHGWSTTRSARSETMTKGTRRSQRG